MSVWLGGDEADAIYLGADPVDAVYLGEDQVWPVGGIEYIGSNWNGGTTVVCPHIRRGFSPCSTRSTVRSRRRPCPPVRRTSPTAAPSARTSASAT